MRKLSGELDYRIRYDVEHNLFYAKNVFNEEYISPTFIEYVQKLEAQIEKMKNWCNCKNYQQCLIELAEQGKGMNPSECCCNCKKWEIKENG